MTDSFRFSKTRQNSPYLAFLGTFVHSNCKFCSLDMFTSIVLNCNFEFLLASLVFRSTQFHFWKSQVDLSGFVDCKGGGWLSVLSVAESCALIFILGSLLCFSAVELDSVLCLFVIAMLVAYLTSSTSRKRQMRHSGQHRQWME